MSTNIKNNGSTPKYLLSDYEEANKRSNDITKKLHSLTSSLLSVNNTKNKFSKIISPNTIKLDSNKIIYSNRPHSNIRGKITELTKNFETKLK